MRVAGSARAILIGERTALNFLARLSGIATLTAAFVERVAGTSARILDTRKTTPGLRFLEKAAVRDGGGCNHRGGLFDALMIKDNHIAAAGGLAEALRGAREYRTRHVATLPLIVEVRTVADALLAARSGATRVLLDNFQPADVARAVAAVRALPEGVALEIEVSGGVTLDNVRDFALPGVDFISVGALTHSAPGIDFSLDLEATGEEL
jgi:nicotinate-nucleotide pyrophosphorylase (carboxylating)